MRGLGSVPVDLVVEFLGFCETDAWFCWGEKRQYGHRG